MEKKGIELFNMGYKYYKKKRKTFIFPIKRTDGKVIEFYFEDSKQWIKSSIIKVEDLKDKSEYRKISELEVMLEIL